jgi:hypothetical protein
MCECYGDCEAEYEDDEPETPAILEYFHPACDQWEVPISTYVNSEIAAGVLTFVYSALLPCGVIINTRNVCINPDPDVDFSATNHEYFPSREVSDELSSQNEHREDHES